ANKVDNATQELESAGLWSLGLGQPWPVSALHGRGSGDLLDEILSVLPAPPDTFDDRPRGPRRVALVGRPNVGKSSLLNRLARENQREIRRVPWALRVKVSAKSGRGVDKFATAMRTARENWEKRVPTGQLNQWLTALVQATPHPIRGGRAPRVLFATQAGTRPPRFVLFTTGQLDPGYVRFVERKLREEFDFAGTPVVLTVRPRKRRGRGR